MSPAQVKYFMHHLPFIELRRHLPIAQLEAAVRNAMGGKPDPNDKEAKTLDPSRVYNALELLPWFARPDWIDSAADTETAQDFMRHVLSLPVWVLNCVDVEGMRRLAG